MSAYKTVECEIVDSDILLEALEILSLSATKHEEAQPLRGYKNDLRNEKAEIVILKEKINLFTGASNDIVFKWNAEAKKYDMIISEYDKAHHMDSRIIQAYVKIVLEKALEKNGFKIKVNIEDDLTKRKMNDLNIIARKII